MAWTLAALAEQLGLAYEGDGERRLTRVAALESADGECLSFLSRGRMLSALERTGAGAVVVAPGHRERARTAVLVADNPYAAFARAAQLLHPEEPAPAGVDAAASVADSAEVAPDAFVGPRAVIESGAVLGAGAIVEAGAVIGRGVHIGAGTRVSATAVVRPECVIGERCCLHPGVVIGSAGFGFAPENGRWVYIPQVGRVVIGDDVHIGANTTIDRGSLDDTIIGDGVILDNQIQIGHNVRIGDGTAMAGCVGVAGSAVIGRRCAIGGGVGILGHLEIADDVHVTAMSLVHRSITAAGTYSSGVPLEANAEWRRNAARFRQLDGMARRLRGLEEMMGVKKGQSQPEDGES